ncbi:MAG: hypothetical protein FWC41_10880 [Firmicutes bacterium]|nr:hypothetical protein [Bacillota bacterium]
MRKIRKAAEFKFRKCEDSNDGVWMMKANGRIIEHRSMINLLENVMVDIIGKSKTNELLNKYYSEKKQRKLRFIWKNNIPVTSKEMDYYYLL